MDQELRTTCNRDCPDSCGIVATVRDGRIIKHRGDPEHEITRGFLCYRGNHYLERFYSKDRVLYPQRRTEKGWERITWDDALDLAARKLTYYRDKFGPLSILVVNYSGINGSVAKLLGRIFWSHFGGATFTRGGLSVEASRAAQKLDFGRNCTHAPEDLVNSAGFVLWGMNIAVTRPHAWQFVSSARKKGARLNVIDPVYVNNAVNEKGLLAVPVLLWALGREKHVPGKLPEDQAIRLARYTIARYQANHVAWFLPGDGNYFGGNAERWKRIGRAVFNTPGHAPAMLHPQGMQWPWDAFLEEKRIRILDNRLVTYHTF